MNWVSGLALFVMIWWTLLFIVLPWGVGKPDRPVLGSMPGAPQRHHMLARVLINTALTVLIWLGLYLVIELSGISFRPR